MLKGTYNSTPLDASALRAGPPRSNKDAPKEEEAKKKLIANTAAQTPSLHTRGPVNSNIAQNVRAGFKVGGAEGEHQDAARQATEAELEAQRSRNVLR